MQLTEQQIDDIVEGKLNIPALSRYHFYAPLDAIFAKAQADQNFIHIPDNSEIFNLPDGRFVSTHFLIFKDQGELMVFHNEAGHDETLRATPGFMKLIHKFFKPVKKGEEIEAGKHNARFIYRGRLLRSYIHVFGDPVDRDLMLMDAISEEDYLRLQEDFEVLKPQVFNTLEMLEADIANEPQFGLTYKLIKVEGVYNVVVEESQNLGFQIMVGESEGRRIYSFLSHNRFSQTNLNMKELYENITKQSLPNELKRIIAFAYTLATGKMNHDKLTENS